MTQRAKRYVLAHLCAAAAALLFAGYAWLMQGIFPNGFYHCALHDFLHLYCPFCGGTRTVSALLRFDFLTVLRLNQALPPAALCLLVLDVRALVLLCRRAEGPLFPEWAWPAAVAYFTVYFVARNALLLFGVDPAGDLLAFWQGFSAFRAAMAAVALTFAGAALFSGLFLSRRRSAFVACLLLSFSAALWLYLPR